MNDFRVISSLSPELEVSMYHNFDDRINYDSLKQIILFFKSFKNSSLFIMPSGLQGIMSSNSMLRVLKEQVLNDSQSNIVFDNSESIESCIQPNLPALFANYQDAVITSEFILNYMHKRLVSRICDYTSVLAVRQVCDITPLAGT